MTTNIPEGLFKGLFAAWPMLVVVGIVVAASMIFKTKKRSAKCGRAGNWVNDIEDIAYRARPYLLSKAEYSFYRVLQEAIGNEGVIFAKVRLADLVDVESGCPQWQTAFNKIQSKHIDFVLCDPRSIKPLVLIELNDSSHNSQNRQARDNDLAMICESASLPLVTISQQRTYSTVRLYEAIGPYLN
jgi:hypothetical protein